jgi:hypothetical protein
MEVDDAERDRVVRALTRFCGDGRLTLDELEERVAEVYAATTTADIQHALRQLPAVRDADATARAGGDAAQAPAGAPMIRMPAERSSGRGDVALRVHLVVYLSVIGFLVAIWFLTSPFGYFWPIWPALGWGLAIAIHAGVERVKGDC